MSTQDSPEDSDSSSSSSWIFVDEKTPESVAEETSNKKLSESDVESDGISVISEPEDIKDGDAFDQETQETVENLLSEHHENMLHDAEFDLKKIFYAMSVIGAGVVVAAVLIAPYFNENSSVTTFLPNNLKKISMNTEEVVQNYQTKLKRKEFEGHKNFSKALKKERKWYKHCNPNLRDTEKRKKESPKFKKFTEKMFQSIALHFYKREQSLEKWERKLNEREAEIKRREERLKERGNVISGYWHTHLHENREEQRKKQQYFSNWFLNRGIMRGKLRDKAHWYFQWMIGREESRYNRHYFDSM